MKVLVIPIMSTFLLYSLLFVIAFNVMMFFIAYRKQTDKLTDITYSLSFIALVGFGAYYGDVMSSQGRMIMALLVLLWAGRLGYFLLSRVSKLGKDDRFDEIRTNKRRFFRFFLLQGISSWIISLPFLIRLSKPQGDWSFSHVQDIEWIGLIIALIGFIIEAVADHQKSAFKAQKGNKDKLYTKGLYRHIRYPNYLGEMLFWIGIFIAAAYYFVGWDWLSIISPVSIILLLLYVSGIPFLERGRAKKYGDDPEYQSYLNRTKKVIPGLY